MHDLSLVTDALRDILTDALKASPVFNGGAPTFSVNVSSQHPETPSGNADCELCLYLFHVGMDKFQANSFWRQPAQTAGGQPVAYEQLPLDLWYMLSAQSQLSYQQEQQVLSVAMQAFHEHARFTIDVPTPPPDSVVPSEAVLILESPTFDEMSRLWQALGVPLRTTAQYRVSVVFLGPDTVPDLQPIVTGMNMAAGIADPPADPPADPSLPGLLATRRTVSYVAPGPATTIFQQSPASAAPAPSGVDGQVFSLDGSMLADTDQVLLVSYDSAGNPTDTDVTAWRVPVTPPYSSPPVGGVPFLMRPPDGPDAPAPGRYGLVVIRPSLPGFRSNAVPLNIAPWIDPTGGPLCHADGSGRYSLTVRAVPDTGASLRLGAVRLTRIADGATPDPGEWQCTGGTAITFAAPADTSAGTHQIGLRAGDVEADPALWAVV